MSKKKEFNYAEFHFTEVAKMVVQLESESDRAVALIVSAWLDDILAECIKRGLVDDKKVIEEAFQFESALGTFSSRIALGYLIRRMSRAVYDTLTTIRKIRNEFAHSRENLKFTEQSINALCNNLFLKRFTPKGEPEALQPFNPRDAFIATSVGLLGLFIECVSSGLMPPEGEEDVFPSFMKHMAEQVPEMIAWYKGQEKKRESGETA